MKYQDYYNDYKEIQALEIAELHRCIEAHGGEYDWNAPEHENEYKPIVCANLGYYVGDVDVNRVHVDIMGRIIIDAKEHDGYADMQFDAEDVAFSHLSFIMDYMSEKQSNTQQQ